MPNTDWSLYHSAIVAKRNLNHHYQASTRIPVETPAPAIYWAGSAEMVLLPYDSLNPFTSSMCDPVVGWRSTATLQHQGQHPERSMIGQHRYADI